MAGKEVPGIENADADLFNGATWCICPSPTASKKAIDTVSELARVAGAEAYFPDPQEHDTMVAATSHLPLLMASALMTLTSSSESWPDIQRVASSGFAGATRLASTVPSMSAGICVTNREAIAGWIDRFIEELQAYKDLLNADPEEIHDALDAARQARQRWLDGDQERTAEVPGVGSQMGAMFLGESLTKRLKRLAALKDSKEGR